MRRFLLGLAILVLATGCTPLRSVVWGASLEAQVDASEVNDSDGLVYRALGGSTTAYWADDIIATMGRGRTVVVVGSTNIVDAIKDGGWNETDEAVLAWTYMSRGADDCMATVRPGVSPDAETLYPGIVAEVAEADTWIVAHLPYTVDWQSIIDAHPEYTGIDGIHLSTPEALVARHDAVLAAARLCQEALT